MKINHLKYLAFSKCFIHIRQVTLEYIVFKYFTIPTFKWTMIFAKKYLPTQHTTKFLIFLEIKRKTVYEQTVILSKRLEFQEMCNK